MVTSPNSEVTSSSVVSESDVSRMVTSPISEVSEWDVSRMVTSPNSELMSRSEVSECDVSRMRMSPSSFPSSAGLKGRHYCESRKDFKVDRFEGRQIWVSKKWPRSIDLNIEKIVKVENVVKIENIVEVEKISRPIWVWKDCWFRKDCSKIEKIAKVERFEGPKYCQSRKSYEKLRSSS